MREQETEFSAEEITRRSAIFMAKATKLLEGKCVKPYKEENDRLWVEEGFERDNGIPAHFFVVVGHEVFDEPTLVEHCVNFEPRNMDELTRTIKGLAEFFQEAGRKGSAYAPNNSLSEFLRFLERGENAK